MATKSFLKNITIKSERHCQSLIYALESAKKKQGKEVLLSCKKRTATEEDIRNIFNITEKCN